MKRIAVFLLLCLMLSFSGCSNNRINETITASSLESSVAVEAATETTVYTDETAIQVDYEPVDYFVIEEDFDVAHWFGDNFDGRMEYFDSYDEQYWDELDWDQIEQDFVWDYECTEQDYGIDNNQYFFGLDDPLVLDELVSLYEYAYGIQMDSENVTIDSFDYLNGYDCYWHSGLGDPEGSVNTRYFTFNQDTINLIASNDHRLERAIMVSLGRAYFIQEIPYSFFEYHYFNDTKLLIDDDWYIDDYEFSRLLGENTQFDFVDCLSTSEWDGVECDPYEYIENGDFVLEQVFLSLTSPIWSVEQRDFWGQRNWFDLSYSGYYDEDLCQSWNYYCDFSNEDLYNAAYEYLPLESVACLRCVRYNRQFYVAARYTGEATLLFRDQTNGAITMDLTSSRMNYVIQAFETAGYPLQTDDNGNIVPESPAHYREVYGEDYTDVLAEYGLD